MDYETGMRLDNIQLMLQEVLRRLPEQDQEETTKEGK